MHANINTYYSINKVKGSHDNGNAFMQLLALIADLSSIFELGLITVVRTKAQYTLTQMQV